MFTSFLRLACSCFSVFQPKQLPEVGEKGGEPAGQVLVKGSSAWFLLVPECHRPGRLSPVPSPKLADVSRELETRETISVWGKNSQTLTIETVKRCDHVLEAC